MAANEGTLVNFEEEKQFLFSYRRKIRRGKKFIVRGNFLGLYYKIRNLVFSASYSGHKCERKTRPRTWLVRSICSSKKVWPFLVKWLIVIESVEHSPTTYFQNKLERKIRPRTWLVRGIYTSKKVWPFLVKRLILIKSIEHSPKTYFKTNSLEDQTNFLCTWSVPEQVH